MGKLRDLKRWIQLRVGAINYYCMHTHINESIQYIDSLNWQLKPLVVVFNSEISR